MHKLIHEFTDKKISPWGGMKYFQQLWTRSGAREFTQNLPLPVPKSNRGFEPVDIVEGFMTSVILGARRLDHCGMLRSDAVIQEIFGWKKGMACGSTFGRFLKKFDKNTSQAVFPSLMEFTLSQVKSRYLTIDIDSSAMTRYGNQEGVKKGYNPHKRGRGSHNPIMAFCDELKMAVNGWMRAGDAVSVTDIIPFTEEVLKIVPPEKIDLMRFDTGFYSDELMTFLEQQKTPINYLIKARMTTKMIKEVADQKHWLKCDDITQGAIYSEGNYHSQLWQNPRRVVFVGIPLKESKKLNKIQKRLFEEEDLMSKYEFFAYITNSKMSAVESHRRYNQRGDAENRIKELKYDFAADGFVTDDLKSTEAAFRLVLVTYNLMQIFKQAILQPAVNHRLPTIKLQCIALGSYITKTAGRKRLKISAEGKRRHFLEHIFEKVEHFKPPYAFSNA
jgi:hypothetical protein